MFKGFECDSITVPSCDFHNSKKSGNDHAIVNAFLIPLYNGIEIYPLTQDVKVAITKASPYFDQTKKRTTNVPLLKNPPGNSSGLPNTSHIASSAQIRTWMRELTAALVFNAANFPDSSIKWEGTIVWSPNFIGTNDPIPLSSSYVLSELDTKNAIRDPLKSLKWQFGWSAFPRGYPPNIYFFELYTTSEETIFKHIFYKSYEWYVWVSHAPKLFSILANKVM